MEVKIDGKEIHAALTVLAETLGMSRLVVLGADESLNGTCIARFQISELQAIAIMELEKARITLGMTKESAKMFDLSEPK